MATYYSSSSNGREATPILYSRGALIGSYEDSSILPRNMMMHNSGMYMDSCPSPGDNGCGQITSVGAAGTSQQQQEFLSNLGGSEIAEHDFDTWRGEGRSEMVGASSMRGPTNVLHGGQNLQGQGLSLTLSTQIPSGIQMPSIPYRNSDMGLASFLSPNPTSSGDDGCRNGSSRDEQLAKGELSQYSMSTIARTMPNSKYLKAAQQLLDEAVNVRKALKRPNNERNQSSHEHETRSGKNGDAGTKNDGSMLTASGASSNPQETGSNSTCELSHAEKQDLQNKLTKLLYMLDEVDRRYNQYYHQMQIVVSSFDVIAGCGASKPYTALALQTISRHFRCLRDAIAGQVRATRKSLGEHENSGNDKGVGITRLRYVDQQLRQQRALQQLGMIQQHAWRPQRGLPENSVSILRAWLFEHFLHPYPKDSDKIMLARQTGLTRSQVSNWFINARVRLWKPMVEEMYKEEAGSAEMDSISSSENVGKGTKGDNRTFEDNKEEDLQQSTSSTATERCSAGDIIDLKSDQASNLGNSGSTRLASFQNGAHIEAQNELVKSREELRPNVNNSNFFPDAIVQSQAGSDRFMAAAAAYHMSELGRFGAVSGVSLTLGLQHCEGGGIPMPTGTHHGFAAMRGDEMYNAAASSLGDTGHFECVNAGNPQPRFGPSHLYHDFVV
ncbi:BEL1-like homeodomain protein 7 [Cucurbita moschata]|uniref:BEL1-like homeodomain protein 7 n=1 Tax=Cucurbita moschata TaxID=3662 RepID=A0A6J1G6N8_CUCMO|nr:BEL1-like homeodomain protein 7 [Cucurbita moschata]XP_022947366.1 BEL1-like homeodomain protein 7 [Cucurbita moschata]